MGIKNLPDGKDFHEVHDAFPKDFGFSGSAESKVKATRHRAAPAPEHNPMHTDEHPGHDGGPPGNKSHFADGGNVHPHGHHVVHVEHHEDGTVIHHHDHGGMTVHHADGHVSHHDAHGEAVHAHGGPHHGGDMQDSSTLVGKMQRGHGHQEPDGDEGMAGGGKVGGSAHEYAFGGKARLPRGMKPVAAHQRSPIGHTAPMTSARMPTPRNPAPGGKMGMGVEPSAEPDVAGSDMPGGGALMRRGGPFGK